MRREVPDAVEEYLIGLYVRAGRMGGGVGAGGAGAVGGGWGAKLAARLMRTKVEQRSGAAVGTPEEVVARVLAAHPDVERLPAEDRVRLAVPAAGWGLQEVVVDLEFGRPTTAAGGPGVHLVVTGFGKEGLISRSLTRDVTDQVWAAVTSAGRQPRN